jgi:hypothetical protein
MTKVFISQPMRGKTDEEILAERKCLEESAREKLGEDVVFLGSFFGKFDVKALQFLGRSLEMLAEADAAIFGRGWTDARGCRIEHMVCEEYGIKVIEDY